MSEKVLSPVPDALLKGKPNPDLVEVPGRSVLTLDGAGAPGAPEFVACVGALYGVAYTLRFARKAAGRPVFKVGPLEGEWRAEGSGLQAGVVPSPDRWRWRLRMGVPPDVGADELAGAVEAATTRPKGKLEGSAQARRISLVRLEGARFARILHVGPYATEPASFAKIGELLDRERLRREPWHIEVYLSDPGRTAPEKLKTVLLAKVR